jgi:hypothetical protein
VLLAFRRRWRLPGATRVPSWGCAARTLIARLQVCDPGLVVTVAVLFWFPLGLGVLGRFIVYVFPRVGLLGLLFVRIWDVGFLGLLFVRIWDVGFLGLLFVRIWDVGFLGLRFLRLWKEG